MSENNNDEAKEMKFDLEVAPMESITKAEVDCQIATARQYPRSLAQFYKRAEAMITCDQETAESCFYQLRRKDNTQPNGYKIIEGESVRMAEIVAANFGNLRSAVHITGHTPTRVSVRAVCHDLETNNLIAVEKQARTTYKDGTPYNEDMSIMTTNALVSKALRDAIFRVVPKALVKPLKEKAKLVAFGEGTAFIERRHKAIVWATVTRKVPMDRVLAVLGVKGEEDMTIEHLEILTGLKNAIMEGDQTVDEAFPSLTETNKPVFEHPAKKEQEQTKKTEVKQETKAKSKAPDPKVETKPEPTKEPEPSYQSTKAPVTTAVTEPVTSPVAEPAAKEEPKPEPKVEPKPEVKVESVVKDSSVLTEIQATLKKEIESLGYMFADFVGWGKTALPPIKSNPPASWADIADDKAAFYIKNKNGIATGIKRWKGAA